VGYSSLLRHLYAEASLSESPLKLPSRPECEDRSWYRYFGAYFFNPFSPRGHGRSVPRWRSLLGASHGPHRPDVYRPGSLRRLIFSFVTVRDLSILSPYEDTAGSSRSRTEPNSHHPYYQRAKTEAADQAALAANQLFAVWYCMIAPAKFSTL